MIIKTFLNPFLKMNGTGIFFSQQTGNMCMLILNQFFGKFAACFLKVNLIR